MTREGLISREQLDQSKATVDIAAASLNSAKARLAQTEAQAAQVLKQKEGLGLRINQQRASLTRLAINSARPSSARRSLALLPTCL